MAADGHVGMTARNPCVSWAFLLVILHQVSCTSVHTGIFHPIKNSSSLCFMTHGQAWSSLVNFAWSGHNDVSDACVEHRSRPVLSLQQESRADARVSAREGRHLAINFEFGFLSSDWRSNLCCQIAKALELRKYLVPQTTLVWRRRSGGSPQNFGLRALA